MHDFNSPWETRRDSLKITPRTAQLDIVSCGVSGPNVQTDYHKIQGLDVSIQHLDKLYPWPDNLEQVSSSLQWPLINSLPDHCVFCVHSLIQHCATTVICCDLYGGRRLEPSD
jgi:hypothetical protein